MMSRTNGRDHLLPARQLQRDVRRPSEFVALTSHISGPSPKRDRLPRPFGTWESPADARDGTHDDARELSRVSLHLIQERAVDWRFKHSPVSIDKERHRGSV